MANTPNGRLLRSSGTSTAASANIFSLARPILVPMRVRLMIEILVTSLPVPQVVGTMTSSWRFSRFATLSYSASTGPPSETASTFAMSMTVPPPIAMIRLQPVFTASAAIASTMTSVGSPAPYFSWKIVCTGRFSFPK